MAAIGIGELVSVGVWLRCGVSLPAEGMLKGDRSGYLSSTVKFDVKEPAVTLYGISPIPELPISVAFGYLSL